MTMSPTPTQATVSMQVWTVYVFVVGIGLLLVPNLVLALFGVEQTTEVWIRVVGVVVVAIGVLYASMVRRTDSAGYRATVYERSLGAAALGILALTVGPWQLAIFAVIDLVGAVWTFGALRVGAVSPPTSPAGPR